MLIKITDLEEKLLETELRKERLTDEKLTHMLSVQKSPTNKTGIGYVASTSKTAFVKPTVPSLYQPAWIRERLSLVKMFQLLQNPLRSLLP